MAEDHLSVLENQCKRYRLHARSSISELFDDDFDESEVMKKYLDKSFKRNQYVHKLDDIAGALLNIVEGVQPHDSQAKLLGSKADNPLHEALTVVLTAKKLCESKLGDTFYEDDYSTKFKELLGWVSLAGLKAEELKTVISTLPANDDNSGGYYELTLNSSLSHCSMLVAELFIALNQGHALDVYDSNLVGHQYSREGNAYVTRSVRQVKVDKGKSEGTFKHLIKKLLANYDLRSPGIPKRGEPLPDDDNEFNTMLKDFNLVIRQRKGWGENVQCLMEVIRHTDNASEEMEPTFNEDIISRFKESLSEIYLMTIKLDSDAVGEAKFLKQLSLVLGDFFDHHSEEFQSLPEGDDLIWNLSDKKASETPKS